MMTTDALGLYVHIPFCKRKCSYCDFCSFAGLEPELRGAYIDCLCAEITSYKEATVKRCDSIFFGGGTPSLLSPEEFYKIADALFSSFEIMPHTEFTVEVNPGTATREGLAQFKSAGVNRLSIGLQSIHENELKKLGRIHDYKDFLNTYNLARELGYSNIGVDLMYGIPEQTEKSFDRTLREIISLSPEHLSAYALIVEPGTPFYDSKESLRTPSPDAECNMYEHAAEILKDAGYFHYEISNYARGGYESRHNLKYWTLCEYIGFGLSAYSMYGGKRFGNTKDIGEYVSGNTLDSESIEILDNDTLSYEYVMLRLRLAEGMSLSEYKKNFGKDFLTGREPIIESFCRGGLMTVKGDRISLSDRGLYVSNSILTDLI